MKPTMRDVAIHANVSVATVSHVINNTRFVSPETRAQVMDSIAKLGYTPDIAARSFKTGRRNLIAFIVPDIANPFFATLIEEAEAVLNRAGYVNSVRGAQGGYRIAKDPSEYTVGMILRLTEGSMAPVACLDEGTPDCDRCDTCETLEVWKELYAAINNVIDNVTIADLVEKSRQRAENLDYSI